VLSFIQYPLFWAGLAIGCSGGSDWAVALFIAAWAARAGCARGIDRAIPAGAAGAAPIWLLPLRDIMSMAIALVAYTGDRVEWRGRVMHTKRGAPIAEAPGEATTAYSAGRFGYAPASYVPPGPPATS
jgi:hypothetical protein